MLLIVTKSLLYFCQKYFTMKKILLIGIMIIFGLQTFSLSPGNYTNRYIYKVPSGLNAITLQEFLVLTPKKYMELTGRRMSFKQKLAFTIFKSKLKRKLPDDKPAQHKTDLGLLSLIFGGAAFVLAFIPGIGAVVSYPLALAALVLGIIGLGRKKGDTKSIIGLVLGAVFLVLYLVLIALFASI